MAPKKQQKKPSEKEEEKKQQTTTRSQSPRKASPNPVKETKDTSAKRNQQQSKSKEKPTKVSQVKSEEPPNLVLENQNTSNKSKKKSDKKDTKAEEIVDQQKEEPKQRVSKSSDKAKAEEKKKEEEKKIKAIVKTEQKEEKNGRESSNGRLKQSNSNVNTSTNKQELTQVSEVKIERRSQSFDKPTPVIPSNQRIASGNNRGVSFYELNKLIVGQLLNQQAPQATQQYQPMIMQSQQQFKFTPKIDKSVVQRSVDRQGIFLEQDQLQLKRKQSMEESLHNSIQSSYQGDQPSHNLLAQAIQGGPQKQINRQEALARAGINKTQTQGQTMGNLQPEKKGLMSMVGIGGFGGAKPTKQDIIQEKQQKNKKALQENSLVQFAANQPDLYAPITLPFFNLYNKDEQQNAPDLKRAESSKVQQEQVSSIKLQRVESFKGDDEVKDLLFDKATGQPQVSELEPFLLQLPNTLPFQFGNQQDHNVNVITQMIQNLSLGSEGQKDPLSIGKLRVMKSGKVVLRISDPQNESVHIDYEIIKGIQTNFYQELVSVVDDKPTGETKTHFLAPVNNKLIAVPDLDSIFE